ncbi:hypothetical protein [Pseudoalteromonas sp. PB2-1]|uniref:hypothetical protein n=1 Tax=Pseudoalteromonas sp. PB2-1 TaxID=2907242 RepID=UPI00386682D5
MAISLANSTPIPVKHTQMRKLSSDELVGIKKKVSELQPHGMEDYQQQINAQNQVHQHTVLEVKGRVIAAFGDNDWRFYPSSSDSRDANKTDIEVINSLKLKYGETLKVATYPHGQGPTKGEILEKVYGAPPNRVNTTA